MQDCFKTYSLDSIKLPPGTNIPLGCHKLPNIQNFQLGDSYQTKLLTFILVKRCAKTSFWEVRNTKSNFLVGTIQWDRGWRQYVFSIFNYSRLSKTCLQDISTCISTLQMLLIEVRKDNRTVEEKKSALSLKLAKLQGQQLRKDKHIL